MQGNFEDIRFHDMDSSKNYKASSDDDIYVNTEDFHPKPPKCADISKHTELKNNKKTGKIFISAFSVLLILCALSTLCVIGIFYHNKVVSYEILSKKYANITTTLMVHERITTETERTFEELKVKYQQVQEILSSCNENKTVYEEQKEKCQKVQEELSTCIANKNSRQCENGWESFGWKCYYFSTSELTWTQSRDKCLGKGGHLVTITSRAEQNFLSSQIRVTHWIGLNDLETEGVWMWVNNLSLKDTGLMFWFSAPEGPNEPDNWKKHDPSGENCGSLGDESGATNHWFDASCLKGKRFICEK
ncbi:C-type lectin domain family 4 member E-like [Silurus meridionalis]|uniref:C-type lectin domain-containing protein n=1 Tax=Silurus meridionalis TaxID=175797 RepID=A0A8T0A5W4_SILME|nr:C-type lectin domain family 4 member E-like [Silurus meridionalis]KAF7686379.1 hypothetical protein HF521_015741 [Silurus meridionalis]